MRVEMQRSRARTGIAGPGVRLRGSRVGWVERRHLGEAHHGHERPHPRQCRRSRGRAARHVGAPRVEGRPRARAAGDPQGRARSRRVDLRGHRDPQRRAQRRRRPTARGVRLRADRVRRDPPGRLRHPRAHPRHERQRRARVDVLPVDDRLLRPAVQPHPGPRARLPPAAGVQRLAHRRVVRHLSGPVHAAGHRADLGPRAHGRRGAPGRGEGLPRGHVLREPHQARLPELPHRPLGPVLARLRGDRHRRLPPHRFVVVDRGDLRRRAGRRDDHGHAGQHRACARPT